MKHEQTDFSQTRAAVVPTVRYRDLPAAIEWLCKAFGFERHRVVTDNDGSVLYAQLTFGQGMVMVAPIQETAFGKLMVQPDEIGGVETQICYLRVDDPSAHQARAAAAGGDVVLDIKAEASTGQGYSCRDPEGHIWNFGTYDPWDAKAVAPVAYPGLHGRKLRAFAVATVLAAAVIALYAHEPARAVAGDLGLVVYTRLVSAFETARASGPDDADHSPALAHTLGEVRDQLAKERAARLAADQRLTEIRDELVQVRRATYGRDELMQARLALEITAGKLAKAIADKDAAERSANEARDLVAQLRGAMDASEKWIAAEKAAKEKRARARRAYWAIRRAATPKAIPSTVLPQPDLF
jgi:uncharacterized glyoxalase superfamily protein PhnB